VTRTPGTGIRKPFTCNLANKGKALSIGLLPFSVVDLPVFRSFDSIRFY